MTRSVPVVDGTTLLEGASNAAAIPVDTPAWFGWLEQATVFACRRADVSFTARKERKQRGGWYWTAYYRHAGRRFKAYLGKSEELTLARLHEIARRLAERSRTAGAAEGVSPTRAPPSPTPASSRPRPPLLLRTKLAIPPLRASLVSRPRLFARLDAVLTHPLTLLAAPAGFGKTTLVAAWLNHGSGVRDQWSGRQRREDRETQGQGSVPSTDPRPLTSGLSVAWLALDAEDNDPNRFLRYLVAAIQRVVPTAGAGVVALLQSPQPPSLEPVLTQLLYDLHQAEAMILVLDDYHLVRTPAIHQAITFVLDHLPPHFHLIVLTREDPPLPLARLRARRQLLELRAADLSFTTDEAALFLRQVMGLPLAEPEIAALEQRTEGWIAGLQLAALAMRDHTDVGRFIVAFTGNNRFIVDYLADEVLNRQPAQIQTFLLQTAILDRLCGPLCDAVIFGEPSAGLTQPTPSYRHHASSQTLLNELERANLFLMPLDDERVWYRYHHLFADVLRARLRNAVPAATVALLHQRASAWFAGAGLLPEAINYALAAGAVEQAADLIARASRDLFAHGAMHRTIITWLAALPEDIITSRPGLCVLHASLLADLGDLPALEQRLSDAEQALTRVPTGSDDRTTRGEIAALHALLAENRAQPDQVIAYARQALSTLPDDNVRWRGAAAMLLGRAYLGQADIVRASRVFTTAAALVSTAGEDFLAYSVICNHAYVLRAQGRLGHAIRVCREAIERATARGDELALEVGLVQLALADLLRERNELPAALHYATEAATRLAQWGAVDVRLLSVLVLARVKQAQGDEVGARAALEQAGPLIQQHPATPSAAILGACGAQLALANNDPATALAWLREHRRDGEPALFSSSPLFFVYGYEHSRVARAQVLCA